MALNPFDMPEHEAVCRGVGETVVCIGLYFVLVFKPGCIEGESVATKSVCFYFGLLGGAYTQRLLNAE